MVLGVTLPQEGVFMLHSVTCTWHMARLVSWSTPTQAGLHGGGGGGGGGGEGGSAGGGGGTCWEASQLHLGSVMHPVTVQL